MNITTVNFSCIVVCISLVVNDMLFDVEVTIDFNHRRRV